MPESTTDNPKTIFLILGMHRSGTSVATRCCNLLGVYLGQDFIETNQYNEKGFWEHSDIVKIHEIMLARLRYGWDDIRAMPPKETMIESLSEEIEIFEEVILKEFTHSNEWGVKDPRMCRLLPIWNHVIKKQHLSPKAIIVFRNPLESATSLVKRDQMDQNQALLLWLRYNLDLEYYSRHIPRSFTDYPTLLSDTSITLSRISDQIDADWSNKIKDSSTKLVDFIDNKLKHNNISDEDVYSDSSILPLIKECYSLLHKSVTQPNQFHKEFDAIRNELDFLCQGFDAAITAQLDQKTAIYDGYADFQKDHKDVHAALKEYKNAYNHFLEVQKPLYEKQAQNYLDEIEEIHTKYNVILHEKQKVQRDYDELTYTHQHNLQELNQTKEFNTLLTNSFSWKITKPLRIAKRIFLPSPIKHKENA